MTEPNNNPAPVGNGEGSTGGAAPDDVGDVVTKKHHERVLFELKKEREAKAALQSEKEAREKKDLEERGEYQKLLELAKKEKEEAEAEAKALKNQFVTGRKANALLKALDNGVDDKYFSFLPIDEILLDPESGEINQTSVTKAAESFKKNYPEIYRSKNAPRLPNDAPQGGGALTISRSEWAKLTSKEMKKWKPDQVTD